MRPLLWWTAISCSFCFVQPIYMVTDFIAFDDAVRVALSISQSWTRRRLCWLFPITVLRVSRLATLYTDMTTSLSRLTSTHFSKWQVTANRLVSKLPKSPTSQQIIIALKEYWGMDITEVDVDAILEYKTESRQTLSNSLARILTEHSQQFALSHPHRTLHVSRV
jgi:alkaline phosphatase